MKNHRAFILKNDTTLVVVLLLLEGAHFTILIALLQVLSHRILIKSEHVNVFAKCFSANASAYREVKRIKYIPNDKSMSVYI